MFKLFENGVHVVGTQTVRFLPKKSGKRGKVSTFSKKSSRSLRDLCSRLHTEGKAIFAITLTLPPTEAIEIEWEKLVKRYREYLRTRKLGAIWRVELQRHKIPHLHLIAVCESPEEGFEYWFAWVLACEKLKDKSGLPLTSHKGFLEYSVRIRIVKNRFRWMPYLIGHSVKHKKGQLGWQGRQWGIFNREFLQFSELDEGAILNCAERTGQLVMRSIRRRFSKRIRQYGANGTSILNINPFIIARLVEFYSNENEVLPPF